MCYTVAGRFLLVEIPDQRLAKLIESLFERWLLTPVSFAPQHLDVNLTFNSSEIVPPIPRGLECFEVTGIGHCYVDGNSSYWDLSNSSIAIHQGNTVNIGVWIKRFPDFVDAALTQATSFALCAALRRCGVFELHSAGVASPDARAGVLIVGPSGSGKSTLTLQLMASGWGYLSDDMVFLSRAGDHVEARGFRRFFAVTENATLPSGIGLLRTAVSQPANTQNAKKRFDPQSFFPSARIQNAVPRALFFSTTDGGVQTRISELSQAETMKRLIAFCPWATYDKAIAVENLDILSQLARQTRSFDLFASADLLRPNYASDLLNSYIRN
jgi:hypothetical protein